MANHLEQAKTLIKKYWAYAVSAFTLYEMGAALLGHKTFLMNILILPIWNFLNITIEPVKFWHLALPVLLILILFFKKSGQPHPSSNDSQKKKSFNPNWEKDYGNVKVLAYTSYPAVALKDQKEIKLHYQCKEHLLDLKAKTIGYPQEREYRYCDRCKDTVGRPIFIPTEEIQTISAQAIFDYRKWLKTKI